jgi:hypothetical protein
MMSLKNLFRASDGCPQNILKMRHFYNMLQFGDVEQNILTARAVQMTVNKFM